MGSVIGAYTIERRLATGGMGEVFLARLRTSEGLERRVVIKRVPPGDDGDDDAIAMLLDESRLMAGMTHPNIAQVYDLGRDGDAFYLAMEYVHGPTLRAIELAAKKRGDAGLPEREALNVALAVAEALAYVHERVDATGKSLGIVHRDLSPANVLVTYDGAVKLIDFGIAKARARLAMTTVGTVKGTHGYIAPELLLGMQADSRADVFALGVLLYEMLFLAHPFKATDLRGRLEAMRAARYVRPRDRRPGFPRGLEQLVERCLSPHPEGRPESMRAVVDALAAHLAARSIAPTMTALSAYVLSLIPDPEPRAARAARPVSSRPPRPPLPFDLDAEVQEETIVSRGPRRSAAPTDDDATVASPTELPDAAPLPLPTPKSAPLPVWLYVAAGIALLVVSALAVVGVHAFLAP